MRTQTASRLGFWAALLVAVFTLWFYVAFIPAQPVLIAPWPGMAAYAASFQLLPFLAWIVPAFLLAPTIPTMMTCLHSWAPREKQMWSMLALVFAGVYAAVLAPLYYIEMTVVPYHLANGTTEGLALWLYAYHYPFDIPGALEAVGYALVSFSFLFAAQVFGPGRLQRWLRWTFVGLGLTGLPIFIDPLSRLPLAFLLVDAVANVALGILAPVLLAILFRQSTKDSGGTGVTGKQ